MSTHKIDFSKYKMVEVNGTQTVCITEQVTIIYKDDTQKTIIPKERSRKRDRENDELLMQNWKSVQYRRNCYIPTLGEITFEAKYLCS
jgi:hypothetical protein